MCVRSSIRSDRDVFQAVAKGLSVLHMQMNRMRSDNERLQRQLLVAEEALRRCQSQRQTDSEQCNAAQ
jgi:hypothetical protein